MIEFPSNVRTIGQQRREDRTLISTWVLNDWNYGMGCERVEIDTARTKGSLWDVENIDTRFPSFLCRSPAFITCTIVPSRGDLDNIVFWNNNTYMFNRAGANVGIYYNFISPNTIGSLIETQLTYGVAGAVVCGDTLYYMAYSARGAPAAMKFSYSTVPSGVSNEYNNVSGISGTLVSMGAVNNRVFAVCNVAGAVQLGAYDIAGTISVATGPLQMVGSYPSKVVCDATTGYLAAGDGIYKYDANGFSKFLPVNINDINAQLELWDNDLYLKNYKSLLKIDISSKVATNIGFDRFDGLPSDKLGEITAMASSNQWLFAAVKGATYSNIYTYNGSKWDYYARIPTAGIWVKHMYLGNQPGNIDRLWCVFGNHGYPGFFINPLTNPMQAATYAYVPTGYATWPQNDSGMFEFQSAFYDWSFDVDNTSALKNIIVKYGLDGTTPVTTMGIVASSPQTLTFGSLGVQGYKIQPKIELIGTENSTGPNYRNSALHYLKLPDTRETFSFTIDTFETSNAEARSQEEIIGSLNYLRDRKLLTTFWYGRAPTKNVKIMEAPASEFWSEDEYADERTDMITLRISEII